MKCKFPFSKRNETTRVHQQFACGKCLPCRIRKRSCWVLRCQLEALHSLSRSFWTLTLEDDALMAASEEARQTTIRNFFAALRQSEHRAGSIYPIRYFGCLEFGGRFARPHWHFLIYNLNKNYREPSRYLRGMPRPRIHITQWPHGHIDVAEYNLATTHYVVEYLTDFTSTKTSDTSLRPVPYRTIRPAIGYFGVRQLAHDYAKRHSTISEKPTTFMIGQRNYPLDKWTRDTFMKEYSKAGGLYLPTGSPSERHTVKVIEEAEILAKTPRYVLAREEAKERHIYGSKQRKEAEKARTEEAATARYQAHQSRKETKPAPSGGDDP